MNCQSYIYHLAVGALYVTNNHAPLQTCSFSFHAAHATVHTAVSQNLLGIAATLYTNANKRAAYDGAIPTSPDVSFSWVIFFIQCYITPGASFCPQVKLEGGLPDNRTSQLLKVVKLYFMKLKYIYLYFRSNLITATYTTNIFQMQIWYSPEFNSKFNNIESNLNFEDSPPNHTSY